MGKKGGGANREAQQARADEQERQARVRAGTTRVDDIFKQNFGDDFFKGRREGYLAFANPQLEDQYGKAREELVYSLDRSGLTDSSVRAQKFGDLQQTYDQRRREVADQALGHETQARNAIEGARSNLITSLNATGDAEGAANSAISRASALSQPTPYSPIGQMFAEFTSTLGQQAAEERAQYLSNNAYRARFDTGLFAPRRDPVVNRP
ncbi:hypothetical protein [Salinarimonas soli]|uniref:Uncharacterized protein n=1 Tax=Salinarimonas soli TaxID=1638099 RepID=A0A5B2V998_9HYPH|nr:hypothetical protein [Salinarimonas soli]KAA2235581.1 hypothetical protein F0L46_18955 [Salinarimonas soli]